MNPSEQIDTYLKSLIDWRGEKLIQLRKIINEAAEVEEVWKWDTPVFESNGLVCAISAFKDHVKINFFKGAALEDPKKLFNAGLEAKASRSIDFFENDSIDEESLKKLIRSAVNLNTKK